VQNFAAIDLDHTLPEVSAFAQQRAEPSEAGQQSIQ